MSPVRKLVTASPIYIISPARDSSHSLQGAVRHGQPRWEALQPRQLPATPAIEMTVRTRSVAIERDSCAVASNYGPTAVTTVNVSADRVDICLPVSALAGRTGRCWQGDNREQGINHRSTEQTIDHQGTSLLHSEIPHFLASIQRKLQVQGRACTSPFSNPYVYSASSKFRW